MIPWSHRCSAGFTIRGERSEPSGKPVLHFVHGTGYCGRVYWPMLARVQRDFDLVTSDVQGHGDTDHGGRFHGWNRSAELALEAWHKQRRHYGAAPHFAAGHSFGGVLTALMLAQEPGQFQRAVLLDPVFFSPVMIGVAALSDVVGLYRRNTLAKKVAKRRLHWPDRAAAYANLQGRGMFKGWAPEALQAYVDFALKDSDGGGVELKCRPSREADLFGSYPRRLWATLAKVHTPLLLEYGVGSYPFVAASAKRLAGANACVQSREVAGGHCYMQEDPAAAAKRMRAYLLG